MDEEKLEKIALFRFGVIAPLLGLRKTNQGEKEEIIREITEKTWNIPYSRRSYIARSTILDWLRRYRDSGDSLNSLMPQKRSDLGQLRRIDEETKTALINLRKEFKQCSINVLLKTALDKKIIFQGFKVSKSTLYRLFKKHNLDDITPKEDMRRFEAEIPNDLWQSDCMHGPFVNISGKMQKTFLFAFIDDHSRLITHCEFYLRENLENYIDCLKKSLNKRGIPRKLYVDNGPTFRSHHLEHVTASLGIALLHAKPYRPQGKGKIERWFRTVREQFLSILPSNLTLLDLNKHLVEWVDNVYHNQVHSMTNEAPIKRYTKKIALVKSAPKYINDYFRIKAKRKVNKDRTVSINGNVFEAPLNLIGKEIILLFNKEEPEKIEVIYNQKSYGFLILLNKHINYKTVRNNNHLIVFKEKKEQISDEELKIYTTGELFEKKDVIDNE